MRNSKNICIIGAGFGGLQAALKLEKKIRKMRDDWTIYLIDTKDYHVYKALLYEVATGFFEQETNKCEGILRKGVCMPIESIQEILGTRHVGFVNKRVSDIDMASRSLKFSDGETLPYEYLILAAGSETEYFNIPGLKENSVPLKDVSDALEIRRRIIELCHLHGERKIHRPVRFIIGGGGFTGIELACEIVGFLKKLAKKHRMTGERRAITIIEASHQILPGIDPKVVNIALKRLHKLGIEVKLDSPITTIRPNEITLKSGEILPADLVIWTGGVRASSLTSRLPGVELDKKGRIIVNDYLQMKGREHEYAIGDNALYVDPKTNLAMPPTAQIAVQEATTAAHNIALAIKSRPPEKFESHFKGFVVPMGGKYAIAALKFGYFSGLTGYAIRKWVDLNYFLTIMPFGRAIRYWIHGAMIYWHND